MNQLIVLFLGLVSSLSAHANLSSTDFVCATGSSGPAPLMTSVNGVNCGGSKPSKVSFCSYKNVFCIYRKAAEKVALLKKPESDRSQFIKDSPDKIQSSVSCRSRGDGCPPMSECQNEVDVKVELARVVESEKVPVPIGNGANSNSAAVKTRDDKDHRP